MKWFEKFAIWFAGFALWIFPPSNDQDEWEHSDYEEGKNDNR